MTYLQLVEEQAETIRTLTEQIAAIRALHCTWDLQRTHCVVCRTVWPCETIRIIGEDPTTS